METYSESEYEKFKEAGRITAEAVAFGASLIKVGASLLEVTEKVEKFIKDSGADFAFPPQISINSIAAHYCADPDDRTVFQEGDVVKLDCGAMVDGYVGDRAVTVDLGNNAELCKASEEALMNAIKVIKPGVTLAEIGRAIQESIQKYGFAPVKNLSGHGVGRFIFHGRPSIPNFDTGDLTKLEKGMVIAIEPFASNGMGVIYESSPGNIYSQVASKPVRNIITRNVLLEIQKYKEMPFTTRWLVRKFPIFKVKYALRELLQLGVLREYPPLPDRGKGIVSQHEHTVIVDDPCIVTTLI